MFPQLPGALAAALVICVTPAALRWWWGRALVRLADDPLLPERLAAHNRRFGAVSGGCAALLVLGWGPWALWTVPLLILAQTVGGFPLRKTLYRETWSIAGCLSFFARNAVALFGFWVALSLTPWLVSTAGRFDAFAAAVAALVLVGWSRYSDVVLRTLLRTRPIVDPVVVPRFEALVAAAGLPMPRFEYIPMRGGVLANAWALPTRRRSSVIFTDTLLSRLTPDETIAIAAHELAHLEYYDRARLRRMNIVTYGLIVSAAAMTPVTRALTGSPDLGAAALIWPGALVMALAFRARHRQQNETASDLRAVALTGDGEALASALTTLHTIARVPRRWDQNRERQATHPSLARRIRDIRAAAGLASATLGAASAFRASSGHVTVTFESTRVIWHEEPATTHLLDYSSLVELRLHAAATGAVTLVAAERSGRRWQMTPDAADVSAMQAILDVVDARLTHDARTPAFSAAITRLVVALGWVLAFLVGQFALGFVAVLASIAPAPALLNGAGTAALGAAALLLRDSAAGRSNRIGMAIVCAVIGAALLTLGRMRRTETSRATAPLLALLGACGALAVAAIGLPGLSAIRLHQGARATPAAIVLLLALASACWTRRGEVTMRYASLGAAVTGLLVAVLGSTTFLDLAGRDPFLVAATPVKWTVIDGPAIAEFDVPFDVDTMRLSPHGRLVAVERTEEEDANAVQGPHGFHAGRAGEPLSSIEGDDLVFVDDSRALVLVVRNDAAEIRDLALDGAPVVTWRQTVPDLRWGSLTYDARSNGWTVVGRDAAGRFVRIAGTLRGTDAQRTAWKNPMARGGRIDALGVRGGTMLAVEKRYEGSALGRTPLRSLASFLPQVYSRSLLWRLRDGTRTAAGRSLLDASCVSEALSDDRLACTAFDGTRTRILAIDPETGGVAPIAMMDGRFFSDGGVARGWLSGWAGSQALALRLATGEAVRTRARAGEYVHLVAPAETVIGTVTWRDGSSHVRIHPLPAAAQSARRD